MENEVGPLLSRLEAAAQTVEATAAEFALAAVQTASFADGDGAANRVAQVEQRLRVALDALGIVPRAAAISDE